ncbi:MAG: lamin tail domain-containing protein [Planctomycetaceae bacterium]
MHRLQTTLSLLLCCLAGLASSPGVAQGLSSLRITEVMSSSGVGGTADWWEVTNFGGSAVDITGWKFDDNSFAFANSAALNGITSIGPGESAIFMETASPLTDIPTFRTFWGGSAATAAIGSYAGSGVGLSSAGDGIVLFSSTGSEVTPRVTFGAATTGSSFSYQYDAIGDPTTSPNTAAVVSTAGTLSGQITYLSATSVPQNIGSPGTAINAVPEPSSVATVACGGLLAAGCLARRRHRN